MDSLETFEFEIDGLQFYSWIKIVDLTITFIAFTEKPQFIYFDILPELIGEPQIYYF